MSYIPPDIVEKAKKVDLLTYLQNNDPNELVHISGNNYQTRTHDSLKISNGLWNWFSKGVGGKNAIDYLMTVKGFSFTEAVKEIMRNDIPLQTNTVKTIKKEEKHIVIPKKSPASNRVIDYLMNRGIDIEIINYCLNNNFIYQEYGTENVVFVGYDNNHNIKYAGYRGTNGTRFMGDASGSDKNYSFRLLSESKNNNRIHIFECAIDLLSYATILKLKGLNWKNENLIALSGVYQPAKIIENSKIPIAIKSYLSENNNIDTVVLHLDNDNAGKNASKAIQILLNKNYKVIDNPVPLGKDVNDFLCYKLGLKKLNRNYERI